MADVIDSQAFTSDGITKYRAHVARISHLSHNRPDLKFASISEDTSLGSRERSASSAGSRVVSWKRIQTPIGEATKPLDDRCPLELS